MCLLSTPPRPSHMWAVVIILPHGVSQGSGSGGKESACNAGDLGLMLWLGRSSGEGNGYPLQYSCLQNSTDRGAWWAKVHAVAKSRTQLSY